MSKWLALARQCVTGPIAPIVPKDRLKEAIGANDTIGQHHDIPIQRPSPVEMESETRPPHEPTEPTKAPISGSSLPSVGFVGAQVRRVSQNDGRSPALPVGWLRDVEEIRYRFEEGAAIRQYDGGLGKAEAERITLDSLSAELQGRGLSRDEAEEILRNAQRQVVRMLH